MTLPRDAATLLEHIWSLLERGARNTRSPLRTPVLATLNDAWPDARTLAVLRVDPSQRAFFFGTDRRSPKIRQLQLHPEATLVFNDGTVQVRARVTVRVHGDDGLTRLLWDALSPDQRMAYASTAAPGSIAEGPSSGLPLEIDPANPTIESTASGQQHFDVLVAHVEAFDWLYLGSDGRRRAVLAWESDGSMRTAWVFP